jgi:hypothetical protein
VSGHPVTCPFCGEIFGQPDALLLDNDQAVERLAAALHKADDCDLSQPHPMSVIDLHGPYAEDIIAALREGNTRAG